jgi:hypothetical protein
MHCRSTELQKKGFRPSKIYGVNVERQPAEAPRDHYRRVFTRMMLANLGMCHRRYRVLHPHCSFKDKFDDLPSMKKMHWRLWLKTAKTHQLRIINWPAGVQAPGPNFDLKTLDMVDLGALVEAYIEHKQNGGPGTLLPKIVRWTEGSIDALHNSLANNTLNRGEVICQPRQEARGNSSRGLNPRGAAPNAA